MICTLVVQQCIIKWLLRSPDWQSSHQCRIRTIVLFDGAMSKEKPLTRPGPPSFVDKGHRLALLGCDVEQITRRSKSAAKEAAATTTTTTTAVIRWIMFGSMSGSAVFDHPSGALSLCSIGIGLLLVLVLLCVIFFSKLAEPDERKPLPSAGGGRMLVVTAHPDDETMFFGPLIVAELDRGSTEVHLLCLSRGNFYGDGERRHRELQRAAAHLGLNPRNVTVVDEPRFRDHPTTYWRAFDVADAVATYCNEHRITSIVSFDVDGVSGHRNHVSIYKALRVLAEQLATETPVETPRIFLLESVSLMRKYCRPFDALVERVYPSEFSYSLSSRQAKRLQCALLQHTSQLLWFRHLYRCFSRYMKVNTYQELRKT